MGVEHRLRTARTVLVQTRKDIEDGRDRSLELFARMLLDAIHDFGHSDDSTRLKLCRIESAVHAALLVDVEGCINQERAPVIGRPASFLDILRTLRDQIGPGLADRQDFHRTPYKLCNL
jgi:hypothetical protein